MQIGKKELRGGIGMFMPTAQSLAFKGQVATTDISVRKRAYQLARSGMCKNLTEIAGRLKLEGYAGTSVEALLTHRAMGADLERILTVANDM
jgi:hypothetical protein